MTKGWEGLPGGGLAIKQGMGAGGGGRKQGIKFNQMDRLFSYSSITAPKEEEFKAGIAGSL